MQTYRDILQRMVVNDRRLMSDQLWRNLGPSETFGLDERCHVIARLGALAAHDGSVQTFRWVIGDALAAGMTEDDIVGVVLAIAPIIGFARVANIAPKVALALDFDLEASLEEIQH
jgi:alkylhydroperoxidase/carboxymuconolactone decarboxylase family protein YurZ